MSFVHSLFQCNITLRIDPSMISICDMKKMLGGVAKQNPQDSTYTVMLVNYLIYMYISTEVKYSKSLLVLVATRF